MFCQKHMFCIPVQDCLYLFVCFCLTDCWPGSGTDWLTVNLSSRCTAEGNRIYSAPSAPLTTQGLLRGGGDPPHNPTHPPWTPPPLKQKVA